MNILFRKNFSEGSSGGGGGSKDRSRGPGPRRRGGPRGRRPDGLDFRTHIFLNPSLTAFPREYLELESCSPIGDAPRPSPPHPRRLLLQGGPPQVSFTSDSYTATTTKPISLTPVPKAELADLQTIDKDCFIIPIAAVDRFLPAGVPMPLVERKPWGVSVVEVEDPRLCVVVHLMTPMEPIEPVLESPLSAPLLQQRSAAADLLAEVGSTRTAQEGMLLANLEKNSEFPFISYYVVNKSETDPGEFFRWTRAASLRKFDPRATRHSGGHTFDLFQEVATIARPPLPPPNSKRPRSPATGFIISIYKVFEGDDGEKFEKNWLYWTGARMIYRSLPKSVGLRRITLHKSQSSGDKLYLLLVECSNFLQDLTAAAVLIPALRARLCGYTGLYRTTALF